MENINDINKIAKRYLKSPKIYKTRKQIQVVATSGAWMGLKDTKSGQEYEIFDPSDNLMGGGDYDVLIEPFSEFKDLLRSMKLEIKESNDKIYEGIISTLFQRVVAGAKPKDVVKQATKNHPELTKMEKQIRKDLDDLYNARKELRKTLKKLPKV
tara:strand:+ start:211 stop:675 length:465 start_codon:yes stop_codon:yes gene_type:complete